MLRQRQGAGVSEQWREGLTWPQAEGLGAETEAPSSPSHHQSHGRGLWPLLAGSPPAAAPTPHSLGSTPSPLLTLPFLRLTPFTELALPFPKGRA